MLTLPLLRQDPERVIAGLEKKHVPDARERVLRIVDLDARRRKAQQDFDALQAEANTAARKIGELMRTGRQEEAAAARARQTAAKEELRALTEALDTSGRDLDDELVLLPNLPDDRVPAGRTADDNLTVGTGGPTPATEPRGLPHWDICSKFNLIDWELGVKVTGAGFPVYRGRGARLQRALVNHFLEKATEAGYEEIQPPVVINEASGFGTGQLPDKEGQMYHIGKDNLYLIPTAEVPLTNLYRDEIMEADRLPARMVGYTPCFRREAGSWGAHVRGLNRLHQFDKVEIVQITRPEDSPETLELMCRHVEGLLDGLGLSWRRLLLCGGDMSFASAITYDYEVWSPGQGRWLEVSSVSDFGTFQANRLKLRYRTEARGKTALCHTLNGSALALPRIMAALLEQGYDETTGELTLPFGV